MPPLYFNRLSIFGKEYNINDFLEGMEQKTLVLDYSQNFFNLSFGLWIILMATTILTRIK